MCLLNVSDRTELPNLMLISHLSQSDYWIDRLELTDWRHFSLKLLLQAMSLQTSSNSVGHLMNLLSNDVSRFDMNLIFGPYIIVGPFQLVILLYLLWREMGISALAGVGLVLFMMPTQCMVHILHIVHIFYILFG